MLPDVVPKVLIAFILTFIHVSLINAQEHSTLKGKILNRLDQQPISFANILAQPTDPTQKILFSSSNEAGTYHIQLKNNVQYEVTISHIGFVSQTTTFSLSNDSLHNSLLLPAADTIQEVEITAPPPAIVRKPDSVIFNMAAFASGNERKLKELLLQLPGVEVDANNAVYFNGQRIEKLLVEGRLFFGGNSELAVKSVPADAVKQVEILEDFNNISFLSGLANQNNLALNVKLKEDKKNFVFGSLQAGGGIKDRYQGKGDLFYYSPKININSINELNNIDERPISSLQSLSFNKLLAQSREESLLKESQPFLSSIILDAERRITSQNRFSALDLGYEITDQLQGDGFIIYASNKDRLLRQMNNQFFLNNDLLINENRTMRKQIDIPQGSLDFNLNYSPSKKEEFNLKLEGLHQTTSAAQNIQSQVGQDNVSEIINETESQTQSLKIGADWHKEYNDHFTGSLKSFFSRTQDVYQSLLISDRIISGTQDQDIDSLVYLQDQVRNHLSLHYTGYYKINKSNHLLGSIGHGLQDGQLLLKNEYQGEQTSPESLSSEQISTINDTYLSLFYKHQINLSQFELGGTAHHLQWHLDQQARVNRSVWLLLPRLKFSTEITNLGEVNLSFQLNSKVPDLRAMNDTSFIINFNTIRTGNPLLIEELSQEFNLSFSRYNILSNTSLFLNGSYHKGIRTIQPRLDVAGINQRIQYIINTIPTHRLFITSRLNKIINTFTITPSLSYRRFDYTNELNDHLVNNRSHNVSLGLSIKKKIKAGSQIQLNYRYQARKLQRQDVVNHFYTNELNASLSYQITESLLINSELKQYFFQSNLSDNYSFTNLRGEIRLSPKNSRWVFSAHITNALNNTFFATNFVGDSFVTVDRAYVFPRVLLASVSFDL